MKLASYFRNLKSIYKILIAIGFILLIVYIFSLPSNLFNKPVSTIVLSKDGRLLSAKIAADGQWRFPQIDSVPAKFERCIIRFEDNYFKYHPGFNPVSLIRASYQNLKSSEIISGGSTISMQICRMSLENRDRNILNKTKEIIMSTRIELKYSKDEILNLYASNAPFGGNIVGLEAASWRYFNRSPHKLSWAESATLAVLPNAPSIIRPGKNQNQLKLKRDKLLKKLLEKGDIDSITYQISINEKLPQKTYPLPNFALHLSELVNNNPKTNKLTSIDYNLQKRTFEIINQYAKQLSYNNINNAAILILDVKDAKVLAYHGNISPYISSKTKERYVDIIQSYRSSGSTLKPFLYAAMLDDGILLPEMLIPDIPTTFKGFRPENFDQEYRGLVAANEALARSLNIPATRMLQKFGVFKFHDLLNKLGFSSITKSANHYGLSLILGGAEVSLWELCGIYASMARELDNFYTEDDALNYFKMPDFTTEKVKFEKSNGEKILSAASIYLSFKAMLDLSRPIEESGWKLFSSSRKIAWKTGTSFGYRDAWAVGVTPEYVVGVWVGNANGEGRAGMTGLRSAAPLMFEVFNILPQTYWFTKPEFEMTDALVCQNSGYLAGEFCPTKTASLPLSYNKSLICPFHKKLYLNQSEDYQVNANCFDINKIKQKNYFVIPPAYEYYYKKNHPHYESPPPFHPNCSSETQPMQFIYPASKSKIYIPKSLDGSKNEIVFEVAHIHPDKIIYWHLNETYLGKTQNIHQMLISTNKGKHKITLNDEDGNSISKTFEVVSE